MNALHKEAHLHITILAYGSRGDVQPYLALGIGLQRAGHAVRLAAPQPFESFVTQHGLDFAPLAGDPSRLSRELVDRVGYNPLRLVRAMSNYVMPLALQVYTQAREACRDADAIIHSFLMVNAGHEIARQRGVPDFSAQTFPVFAPTSAFTALMAPELPLGGGYNRLTHRLSSWMFWAGARLGYNQLRRNHPELPPLSGWPFNATDRRPPPILFGFSPLVIPPPPDWGQDVHVTGYWFLDQAAGGEAPPYEPPAGLISFLQNGPPPVYIGFGSMVTDSAECLTHVIVEGLRRAGQRALLLTGWSGIGQKRRAASDHLYVIDSAPHSWLFPRMAALVHHGGAGTTAAGLRSGVPALIVPFTSDQPFWGRQVCKLGAGPEPIPLKKLTAGGLAEAIERMVSDSQMRARAAALGEQIRGENGVEEAVRVIEQYL